MAACDARWQLAVGPSLPSRSSFIARVLHERHADTRSPTRLVVPPRRHRSRDTPTPRPRPRRRRARRTRSSVGPCDAKIQESAVAPPHRRDGGPIRVSLSLGEARTARGAADQRRTLGGGGGGWAEGEGEKRRAEAIAAGAGATVASSSARARRGSSGVTIRRLRPPLGGRAPREGGASCDARARDGAARCEEMEAAAIHDGGVRARGRSQVSRRRQIALVFLPFLRAEPPTSPDEEAARRRKSSPNDATTVDRSRTRRSRASARVKPEPAEESSRRPLAFRPSLPRACRAA